MRLLTDGGHDVEDVTEAQFLATFVEEQEADQTPTWIHFNLSADDGSCLQVAGPMMWSRNGSYILSYFPPQMEQTHLRATRRVKKDEALLALLDYFRGGRDWYESREWKEVKKPRGCLGMLIAGASLSGAGLWI